MFTITKYQTLKSKPNQKQNYLEIDNDVCAKPSQK